MSCAERKKVVVVGGGIAGSLSAKLLESIADVTLVDP
jgi:flavin-dependent dehydrogenase